MLKPRKDLPFEMNVAIAYAKPITYCEWEGGFWIPGTAIFSPPAFVCKGRSLLFGLWEEWGPNMEIKGTIEFSNN